MFRKQLSRSSRSLVVLAAMLGASGVAFADDNSMSMWTGDSYAYFNNLDHTPARFNTARAPGTEQQNAVVKAPAKEQGKVERRVMLATRPFGIAPTNPFRDNTGA